MIQISCLPDPTTNSYPNFQQFVWSLKNGILLPKLFWPTVRKKGFLLMFFFTKMICYYFKKAKNWLTNFFLLKKSWFMDSEFTFRPHNSFETFFFIRYAGNLIITSTLLFATSDAQNTTLQWNSILRNSLLHLLLLFCKVTKNQRNRWNVSLSWYVKTSQDRLVKIFHQVHQMFWKRFYIKDSILNEILNSFYVTWTVFVMLSLFVALFGSIIFGYVCFSLNYRVIYIYFQSQFEGTKRSDNYEAYWPN